MRSILLYTLLPVLFAACAKDPESATPAGRGGSWTFQETRVDASYSDIEARKGFRLSFSDAAGSANISFLFRNRPTESGSYTPAADTVSPSSVVIALRTPAGSYHSVNTGGAALSAEVVGGKIHLSGSPLRMAPDGAPGADADLQLDLWEY